MADLPFTERDMFRVSTINFQQGILPSFMQGMDFVELPRGLFQRIPCPFLSFAG